MENERRLQTLIRQERAAIELREPVSVVGACGYWDAYLCCHIMATRD